MRALGNPRNLLRLGRLDIASGRSKILCPQDTEAEVPNAYLLQRGHVRPRHDSAGEPTCRTLLFALTFPPQLITASRALAPF